MSAPAWTRPKMPLNPPADLVRGYAWDILGSALSQEQAVGGALWEQVRRRR
jgi:hypothetical protein